MSVTVTASSLTDLVNDNTITPTVAEEIINHAVNILNMYGISYGLPLFAQLQGTAGFMTMTYTGWYAAAVVQVAVAVYNQNYKHAGASSGSDSVGVGGLTAASAKSDSAGGSNVNAVALDAVKSLSRLNFQVTRG